MAGLLVLGAVGAYFLSLEPASEAYDQALVDVGLALGERIRSAGDAVSFDLPGAAERNVRKPPYRCRACSTRVANSGQPDPTT